MSEWRPDWYSSYVTFEIKGIYEEHHPTPVACTISDASGVGVLAWWDFEHEWMTVATIVERPKAMRVWRELVKWCKHEGVVCRVKEWVWRPIGK